MNDSYGILDEGEEIGIDKVAPRYKSVVKRVHYHKPKTFCHTYTSCVWIADVLKDFANSMLSVRFQ